MSLDLRQAITSGVQGKGVKELAEIIDDSVDAEEQVLPGIGVLFEMIWKQGDENLRKHMIDALHQHLQSKQKVTSAT